MPETGPYSPDVLTRIVNVQWAGGLAVEFGNGASDAPKPPAAARTPDRRPARR